MGNRIEKVLTFLLLFLLFIIQVKSQSEKVLKISIGENNKNLYYYYDDNNNQYASTSISDFYDVVKIKFICDTLQYSDRYQGYPKKFDYRVIHTKARNRGKTILEFPTYFISKGKLFKVKLVSFFLRKNANNQNKNGVQYVYNSVLNNGQWVKLRLSSDGIYRISYDELVSMGFSSPQNVKVFGYGGRLSDRVNNDKYIDDLPELPLFVAKGSDGVFNSGDYILFYATGPNEWYYNETVNMMLFRWNLYDSYSYFFITCDQGNPREIDVEQELTGSITDTATNYVAYAAHDKQESSLTHSGALWVGEDFDYRTPTRNISFSFSDVDYAHSAKIKIGVVARATQSTSFDVKLNNSFLTSISVSPYGTYSYGNYSSDFVEKQINNGSLNFSITYNYPDYDSKGWLDYIDVNVYRKLIYRGGGLLFNNIPYVSDTSFVLFKILKQTSINPVLWDITNPLDVKRVNYTMDGNYIVFKDSATSIKKYYLFDGTVYKTPDFVGNVKNQNLHNIGNYDMIIITHPKFMKYANEVKTLHEQKDGLSVGVFDVNEIYNEFASGRKEAGAIRNFLKMYYDRASNNECIMPKYVLLFGDGSYDNKNNFTGNTNFIPTYQWGNSLDLTSTLVTDDFFVLLDEGESVDNGLIDMGIGRFPVDNDAEAEIAVKKLKHYYDSATFGAWRTHIAFIADDEDNGLHLSQANNIANYVMNNYPMFNVKKIFLDAYQQENTPSGETYPEATAEVNNEIRNGVLIMNYTGHGNERGLAAEYVVSVDQMNKWNNYDKMPLFITASCEFAPFDNYQIKSLGEALFLNDKGGAIALLATTRLSSAGQNAALNMAFYQNAFDNNFTQRLGDIYMGTKWLAGLDYNKRKFALLGDPAMRLAYPQYKVVTDSVPDTLSSTRYVTVKGHIEDENGTILTNLNGVIYPIVFDKQDTIQTLGNDDTSPIIKFAVRDKILYKGKASVKNGYFSFDFVVPVDISYKDGFGKISYYAEFPNDNIDAMGYKDSMIVYGYSNNGVVDNDGPIINLYMNDTTFNDGDMTNENPVLLAMLEDESGINTAGNGIGHDLLAVLDGDYANAIILNEFYSANLDDFTKGKVEYNLYDLDDGTHSLYFRAWDVLNNYSESTINFEVVNSSNYEINYFANYPNPFSDKTYFVFKHNHPNENINVYFSVYDLSGRMVYSRNMLIKSKGFTAGPIEWDGTTSGGKKLSAGMYYVQVKAMFNNGNNISMATARKKIILITQ